MREFSNRLLRLLLVAAIVVLGCSGVAAAEFTADFTQSQGDDVKSGKIYVTEKGYCMEMVDGSDKILVIVSPAKRQTVVCQASVKEFRVLAIDDMTSLMNDPFQAFNYTADMGELKAAGTETVNGYECEKTIINMSDTDVMARWMATSLGFPIKIVAFGPPDRVMELSNIVEGEVDKAKFKIPDGYTKWIDPVSYTHLRAHET